MITMSYLSENENTGYQVTAAFMKGNREEFMKMFNLKHPPIGRAELRTIMQKLDFESINKAFFEWISNFVTIKKGD